MHIQPWQFRKIVLILVGCCSALLIFFCAELFLQSPPASLTIPPPKRATVTALPFSFQGDEKLYQAIGAPLLFLGKTKLQFKLPDLRGQLISNGVTRRPDDPESHGQLLLSFRNEQIPHCVNFKTPIYLKYDSKQHQRWKFSDNNSPTSTWLEIQNVNNQPVIYVKMKDLGGTIIEEPKEFTYFTIPEVALPPTNEHLNNWTIGAHKVDMTFFMRQKTKWYGQDLFLQEYGGEEFDFSLNREALHFEDDVGNYLCYVREHDLLAFDGRWQRVEAGPDSQGRPLLRVKKVNEQTISFDLWDERGMRKISLELVRTPQPQISFAPLDIKLVGARSRHDWIAEIAGKRSLLRSDDWLLCKDGKFERISTPEQLDQYLQGELKGELIVLEGTSREGSKLCLTGMRFNETKTKMEPITIALHNASDKKPPQKTNGVLAQHDAKQSQADDYDDEDDDDDDYDDEDDDDDDYV